MNDEGMCRLLEMCREPTLPDDLSAADRQRLRYYALNDLNTYAFVVMAHQNGQIDEQTYSVYCQSFESLGVEKYPALLPLYRENLVVPELRTERMFRPMYRED